MTLELHAGEVHVLLGENGAGKSVLVGILQGAHAPETGEVLIKGRAVRLASAQDALAHGIGLVERNPAVAPDGGRLAPEERERLRALAAGLGINLALDASVGDLGEGERQLIRLLQLLAREMDVFIFDEPSAVTRPMESSMLAHAIDALRVRGKAVLLVSHKLPDALRLADRVTVLRRGRIAGSAVMDPAVKSLPGRVRRKWRRATMAVLWSRTRLDHVRAILGLRSLPASSRLQLLKLHVRKSIFPPTELTVWVKGVPLYFPRGSLVVDKATFDRIFVHECYAGLYSGATVVDVGAHKGYFGAYAFLHGARTVISYEPEEENFACLRRAAAVAQLRGFDWRVENAAVALDDRGGELHLSSESWAHSLLELPRSGPRQGIGSQAVVTMAMPGVLKDALATARGGRVLVKLAVEGAECELVLGTPTGLWEGVDIAFVTFHPFSPCSAAAIADHLSRAGARLVEETNDVLTFGQLAEDPVASAANAPEPARRAWLSGQRGRYP